MNTNAPRLCASAIFITTSCAYSPVLEHAFPRFFRPMEKKKIQTNSKRILVTFSLIDWNKLRWDVNFISREGEKEEKERKKGTKNSKGSKRKEVERMERKKRGILSGEKGERFFREKRDDRERKLARMCRRIFHGPSTLLAFHASKFREHVRKT